MEMRSGERVEMLTRAVNPYDPRIRRYTLARLRSLCLLCVSLSSIWILLSVSLLSPPNF